MMSLLPNTPPTETTGAYAVLALIADPAAAKKRLDQLVAEKTAAQEALVKLNEATTASKREHAEVSARLVEAKDKLAEREAALAAGESRLANDRAALDDAKKLHAAARDDFATRSADLVARENQHAVKVRGDNIALQRREALVQEKEANLTKLEADLATRERTLEASVAEHRKWLESIKPPGAR